MGLLFLTIEIYLYANIYIKLIQKKEHISLNEV